MPPRRLWAARHAAKHAAEARARAAEPPLPGSARATIRTPENAEDIKQKVSDLHNALSRIKGFRKNVLKTFYDIGLVLKEIQTKRLYEAKRFPSFEAFVERESACIVRPVLDCGSRTVERVVEILIVEARHRQVEVNLLERWIGSLCLVEPGERSDRVA